MSGASQTALDLDLRFYEQMLLIRRAEEKIAEHYFEDDMKTPVHMSVGQEAIPVAVIAALAPDDDLLGTYRSHALYLARAANVGDFFLEMYGRGGAPQKGKAGSMHLASPAHGVQATSAVVGTTIPVALGVAYANKRLESGKRTAVFFGDGAIDEGAFWESLNYACSEKLPLVFVCEDNRLAIHSKAADRHGYDAIGKVVEQFRCHVVTSDSTDPAELYRLTREALALQDESGWPVFMHLECYRYLEHVGVGEDFKFGYRDMEEYERWRSRDSIELVRARLLASGQSEADLEAIEARIAAELVAAVAAAKVAPFPEPAELYRDVFA